MSSWLRRATLVPGLPRQPYSPRYRYCGSLGEGDARGAELEYVAGLDAEATKIRTGVVETFPVRDLICELGLDEAVLRAESRRELEL